MIFWLVVIACVLAFANGANDNAKGVATLVGGKVLSRKRALYVAAVATFAGSVVAIFLATELVARFSGKGLVSADLTGSAAFLSCVGLAAGMTVLTATRVGIPISTTHAMVGAIAGVGWAAGSLQVGRLVDVFLYPLLFAPVLAIVLTIPLYGVFRGLRLAFGVNKDTCICVAAQRSEVSVSASGAALTTMAGSSLQVGDSVQACAKNYHGHVVGVDAQRLLDRSHIMSAGVASFARGLNDTPKIAALLLVVGAMGTTGGMLVVGIAIAIGGLIAARRVADTMSNRITDMNDGQAFTANLVTAGCVLFASKLGVPVSTTHVSCGSLFGIGLATGQARWGIIGQILLAWVTTLPMAGLFGWLAWQLLRT